MIRIRRKGYQLDGTDLPDSASSAGVSDPQARLEISPPNNLIFFFPYPDGYNVFRVFRGHSPL